MPDSESYYFVKDNKVYLKSFLDFPDREIGDVLEDEEKSVQYFIDRFSRVTSSICDLEDQISSSTNKGSFLMKVIHMKDQMAKYKAIGDFKSIILRLEEIESELQQNVVESRVKNLQVKQALLKELQAIVDTEDWFKNTNKVKELQAEWIRTGRVEEEEEKKIEPEFQRLVNYFFDQRKEQAAVRRELIEVRKEKYEELIALAKKYTSATRLEDHVEDYKTIQRDWKAIGHIPKSLLEPLWNEFQKLSTRFFSELKKQNRQTQQVNHNQTGGLEGKEKAYEALLELEKSERPSMSRLKSIQKKWRAAGFVDPVNLGDLADRFALKSQVIVEKNFISKILNSKHDSFDERPIEERNKLKIELLEQLIHRDQLELDRMKENSVLFSTAGDSGKDGPIHDRLKDHLKKLNAKKEILAAIQA